MDEPLTSGSTPLSGGSAASERAAWLSEAVACHQRGELERASRLYRKILAADPVNSDALHFFGLACYQQGDAATARACLERAIALNPSSVQYRTNYATVLQHQRDFAAAAAQASEALRLEPHSLEALYGFALALLGQGRAEEAAEQLRAALVARPAFPEAYNGLGNALRMMGDVEGAIAQYRAALALKPAFPEAHRNLGGALQERRETAALEHLRRAVELRPSFVEAQADLADALAERGLTPEAARAYESARALAPDDGGLAVKQATLLPVIAESRAALVSARASYGQALARLAEAPPRVGDPLLEVGQTGFYLAYHGADDRPLQVALARLYERACPSLLYRAPHCRGERPSARGRPLRLGLVSRFFNDHAIGWCFARMVEGFRPGAFRTTLFSIGGGDNPIWREMAGRADRAFVLPGQDLAQARERIAAEELDILLYPDVGMEPMTYFLAFARLAPVQCVAGGHPVTSGIPALDYFVSHAGSEPPDAQAHYSERLLLLDGCATLYRRPDETARRRGRADLGLAEEAHVYLCPQSLFKFHPDFDDALAAVLRGDPEGHLVIFEGLYPEWHALLLERFKTAMPDVVDRIRILPRMPKEGFLDVVALADVVLDTFHFGGGNTSYQALALGTPVVTLPGAYNRGRVTAYHYARMGIAEAVAASPRDYVRLALELGCDPARRARLSGRIRDAASVLFDQAPGLAELEGFLLSLFERG